MTIKSSKSIKKIKNSAVEKTTYCFGNAAVSWMGQKDSKKRFAGSKTKCWKRIGTKWRHTHTHKLVRRHKEMVNN